MATPTKPKSVMKINKDGVKYESNIDACNYYIFELNRAALRDVGKFVKKRFKEEYYSHFKKKTGNAGKACKAVVFSSKNTIYPRVEIGLRTGKVDGFYAFFQEFGTSDGRVPKLRLLQNIVQNNVQTIIEIESHYLSGLEDEAKALSMIESEENYEIEDED